jgi:DNA-binding SARP family transcriptional activator
LRGVRFRLLGPVTAVVDGHVHSLPRAQTRGLLAYLLLNAGRPVSREARVEANLAALVQVSDRA